MLKLCNKLYKKVCKKLFFKNSVRQVRFRLPDFYINNPENSFRRTLFIACLSLLLMTVLLPLHAKNPVRIKDIASFQGIKENQLMGFGLVTGLQGKGDSKEFGLTRKMLLNLAANHGFNLSEEDIASKNVAAVLVTARIGGFVRIGDSVDITISSIGDAKSLEGGILLQTALKAPNGQVFAVGQGRIIAGTQQMSSRTSASIPQGAVVEKELVSEFVKDNKIFIVLRNPDFSTANLIAEAVLGFNSELKVAAKDPGLIEIELGPEEQKNPVFFISQLEVLTVVPDHAAVVIIDKKTGVIVSGSDVVIQECSVSTPSASVNVSSRNKSQKKDNFSITSTTVGELVTVLNGAKLKNHEIVALLEAIHAAGALNAKLIIL